MIGFLFETTAELTQGWRKTYDYKTNEWRANAETARKAFELSGLKPKLPPSFSPSIEESNQAPTSFFEIAYRAAEIADNPQSALRFARETVAKELEKSGIALKSVRAQLGTLDEWKEEATAEQRAAVKQAEDHQRREMQKYDLMAKDSDRGFMATAGIGCGFGAVAVVAHVVMIVLGSAGFLQGPIMYVVFGIALLPIVIGVLMQLAKTAQRSSVESQLYASVREARRVYNSAWEAAEKLARERQKRLIEEVREAEKKHSTLIDAYRMLGHEPPESIRALLAGQAQAA